MGNVETARTSSSRREVGPGNLSKSIGCMSGVFHFLSNHHNRSRKRITSVKRKESPAAHPLTLRRLTTSPPPEAAVEDSKKMRRSSETPRIPVIPQEIRRKKPPAASPYSPHTPPALVARLMGLDDSPPQGVAAGKRRELLRALEKCDEDLQALSRIIEAIRSEEIRADTVVSTAGKTAERLLEIETNCGAAKNECNGEQPSPVSVLDALSSPRNRSRSKRSPDDSQGSPADECSRILKPSRIAVLCTDDDINTNQKKAHEATRRRIIMEPMPSGDQARVEDLGGLRPWWLARRRRRRSASRAMVESVEEVWGEGVGKERWELGRVEAWVEAQLLGELVEELVVELLGWNRKLSSPTRRKRLRF
ncbi:uncharacterized protein LOC122032315 [Zingiber officinale]|uniref:DUF3741 domain-containing protein n=1 Tax=Zingiber officinale TaxID=94328 RepID=A0A8J5BEJ3_ZINOF|nr:uncharacterized protein LOC122032315 [Zingiber officinale]KAG6470606.1 hypothetical protein ZIOFF_071681 [Zingiber officinale]